jgi:hypothetical protein
MQWRWGFATTGCGARAREKHAGPQRARVQFPARHGPNRHGREVWRSGAMLSTPQMSTIAREWLADLRMAGAFDQPEGRDGAAFRHSFFGGVAP